MADLPQKAYIVLSVDILEKMLSNAKAGGLSEIALTVDYEVVIR